MQETGKLTTIIIWLLNHKKRVGIIAVLFVLLVLAVNFAVHYSFIYLDVSSPDSGNITVYASSERPTQKIGGAGLSVIARDTTSIIATHGDYMRTESRISVPWYGFTYEKISLQKDKNADKVAFKNTAGGTCATYDQGADQLLYYQCSDPRSLLVYKVTADGKPRSDQIAAPHYTNAEALPYMGGVIGISYSEQGDDADSDNPGDITAVSGTGQARGYNAPNNMDMSDFNSAHLVTDTYDPTDNRFVIISRSGDIFIGTPKSGKTVDYHHIAPPPKYNQDFNQTLCTLSRDTVYCYQGRTAYGDVNENFDFSKVAGSQIVTYSFADGNDKTHKVTSDLYALSDLQITASGELYSKYFRQLLHFVKAGDTYNVETVSQNALAIAGGDTLYYVQDKAIYAVDNAAEATSHLVFYSPNITPKAIYTVAGRTFIIGTAGQDESTTYAYLLTSTPDDNPGRRLIDLVPIDTSKASSIYSTDLIGSKLYVSLNVYARGVSSQEFNDLLSQQKESALNYLRLSLPISESDIVFSY